MGIYAQWSSGGSKLSAQRGRAIPRSIDLMSVSSSQWRSGAVESRDSQLSADKPLVDWSVGHGDLRAVEQWRVETLSSARAGHSAIKVCRSSGRQLPVAQWSSGKLELSAQRRQACRETGWPGGSTRSGAVANQGSQLSAGGPFRNLRSNFVRCWQ